MKPQELLMGMEVAYRVGAPIRTQLPVPVALQEMCNVIEVEPGERVWVPTNVNEDDDVVYNVDTTNAIITTQKVDPIDETQLTFKQLNSPLYRVNLPAIIDAPNGDVVLAQKKEAVTDGMDKTEVRVLIAALFSGASRTNGGAPSNQAINTVTPTSNDDLYDVIADMFKVVEDYCDDDFALLCGSTVYNEIKEYDKKKALTFNYRIGLMEFIAQHNTKLVKISGVVKNTNDSAGTALMDPNKLLLVGRKSMISAGKPITFVRRKISTAGYPGFEVDAKLQRGFLYAPMPIVDTVGGTAYNLLSYGLMGYESVIFTVNNPHAIAITTDLSAAGVY